MRTADLTAALIGLAPCVALADKLGEHPGVVVERQQAPPSYDCASKSYPHPAWLYLAAAALRSFAGWAFGLAAALTLGVAQGATLTVTSLADSGPGSLRAAIMAANASTGLADMIVFEVSGTITLASRLPDIVDDVTIDGTGAQIVVSGNNAVQAIYVSAGKSLTLNALTIANGRCASPCSGGAILNAGTLKVTHATFTGNSALMGGAIHNYGSLEVTGSLFSDNSARVGGAIHNFDALTVSGTVFWGNSATVSGGAIHNFDTLNLIASAFSGNLVAGASDDVFNDRVATMTVMNSTIACNGAACSASGRGAAGKSYPRVISD
jgi:hypothetical protein